MEQCGHSLLSMSLGNDVNTVLPGSVHLTMSCVSGLLSEMLPDDVKSGLCFKNIAYRAYKVW